MYCRGLNYIITNIILRFIRGRYTIVISVVYGQKIALLRLLLFPRNPIVLTENHNKPVLRMRLDRWQQRGFSPTWRTLNTKPWALRPIP